MNLKKGEFCRYVTKICTSLERPMPELKKQPVA